MTNNQHRYITDYMEQGIDRQPDLSVKKAAKDMHVSASFIYSHWASDLTPKQFLAKKRFLMALNLLTLGKKINQIASELKFCDHIYFSKWFKHLCGISPKQFQVKYGSDYLNGNYEKIDNDLKKENPNMAKILFSFFIGLLLIFLIKASWAFEVKGFVKIPEGCPIESVLIYTPDLPETLRVGLQPESLPYYSYCFDPINLGSSYVIKALTDSLWNFYVTNWPNDETLGSKVFDLTANQPSAQIYEIASTICAGEQGMTLFLPRNRRKIITTCLNPTPNRGELWNFYAVQIGGLRAQPEDTALVRTWQRDMDFWAETTITTIWDTASFGPYVWSILGGIRDTLYLSYGYTPYYFRILGFEPRLVPVSFPFTPEVTIINDSMFSRDFTLVLNIGDSLTRTKTGHLANAFTHPIYSTIVFDTITLGQGIYPVVCSLFTSPYQPAQVFYDTIVVAGTGTPGWIKRAAVCAGKNVKLGSSLTYFPLFSIFALTGNNSRNFVKYDIINNTWTGCETIPYAPEKKKKVKRGCALTNDGIKYIYAVKGNNTKEFWRYDVLTDSWECLCACPCGLKQNGKMTNLKRGVDLVFTRKGDSSLIYLLYGSKTFTFKAYYVEADTWLDRAALPFNPSGKPMREGSCLAYDKMRFIYALKGKYGDFYCYDIDGDTWHIIKSMPVNKKRRHKDGTDLAFDGTDRIYAVKGNNNEFWYYLISQDSWYQLESPAEVEKFKDGALCYAEPVNTFYLLEGNNTKNFWAYIPEPAIGIEEEKPILVRPDFRTVILKRGSVLPKPCFGAKQWVTLYNILGKKVGLLDEQMGLNYPSGLYFLKTDKTGYKLIIIE